MNESLKYPLAAPDFNQLPEEDEDEDDYPLRKRQYHPAVHTAVYFNWLENSFRQVADFDGHCDARAAAAVQRTLKRTFLKGKAPRILTDDSSPAGDNDEASAWHR